MIFHRTATHPQIIERLQKGGIFLSGSQQTADLDRDGIPNTIAEAMAMEVPVVASRVSGIPELIGRSRNWIFVYGKEKCRTRQPSGRAFSKAELCLAVATRGRQQVEKNLQFHHVDSAVCEAVASFFEQQS